MKKILLSLFVGFIGIISFCSSSWTSVGSPIISVGTNGNSFSYTFYSDSLICFRFTSNISCTIDGKTFSNNSDLYCDYNSGPSRVLNFNCVKSSGSAGNFYFYYFGSFGSGRFSCPTCPSCQTCTGYNFSVFDNGSRIVNSPINTDINLYMQGNLFFTDLVSPDGDYVVESACSTGNDCPVISGDIQWSSLYINDIQHESSSNINITIPEEIGWDYERTDENFDLTVSGYNVDTEYIAGIIQTQNSKPSQGDLNKLVSEVLPLFIPGLAVILLLYFIFRFIKKIF